MNNGFKQTMTMIDNVTKPMKDIQKQTQATKKTMDAAKDALNEVNQAAETITFTAGGKMYSGLKKSNLELMEVYKSAGLSAKELQNMADELGVVNPYVDELGENAETASGGLKTMFGAFTLSSLAMKGLGMVTNGVKSLLDLASEQKRNKNLLQAMIGDEKVAEAMFGHIKGMAADSVSGVGIGEMTKAYQTFMSTTKNVSQLDKLANITERLALFDTTGQGFAGSTFSMKELASGDYTSVAERFNISRSKIQEMGIHTLFKEGDIEGGIAQFEVLLDQMGYTQAAAERMADDPSVKWNQFTSNLKTKFGEAMDNVMNKIGPLISRFTELTNSTAFEAMVGMIVGVLSLAIDSFTWFFDIISFISPILPVLAVGLATVTAIGLIPQIAALGTAIYQWVIYNGTMLIMKGMAYGAAVAMMVQEGATWAAAAAQYGLNAALWANPIVWVIAIIVALIAAMLIWSEVAGVVVGSMFVLGAFVTNMFIGLWNLIMSFAEFFANVFRDPIYAIKKLFYDLWCIIIDVFIAPFSGAIGWVGEKLGNAFIGGANMAIGAINWIIQALNKIPGVNLGDGFAELKSFDGGADAGWNFAQSLKGNAPERTNDAELWEAPKADYINYQDAYNSGYDIGYGGSEWIKDKLGNIFGQNDDIQDMNNMIADLPGAMPGSISNPAYSQEIDISEESIKLMRDVANMRFVQNFVTVTPNVNFGDVTVNENADYKKFASGIVDELEEGLQTSASGVYSG